MFGASELRAVIADAVRRRVVSQAELRRCLEELGRIRGAVKLRDVLDELHPDEARTRSELEALYLRVTAKAGLPAPAVNHPVRDFYGRRRYLDIAYPDHGVAVELDGGRVSRADVGSTR